jgi:fibro-slime domain-containing protein
MLENVFRPTSRLTLGLVVVAAGLWGCTAGVNSTQSPGTAGSTGTAGGFGPGSGGSGPGGIIISGGGRGGTSTGAGGTLPVPPGCGDGINNQGGIEDCDDGNTRAGDGCNGVCHVEPNWNCPSAGACARKNACGDGVISAGEVCDDRNTTDGDGCNATCTVQDPAFTCIPGSMCTRSSQCGNRRVEPGENCDDGNTTANDGCSASCQVQGGYVCPAPGMPCTPAPRCGDGIVQATRSEVCDDGNSTEGDGCSADCRVKGAGCSCIPGMRCTCPEVRCGNGSIEGNEKCDDGNAASNDGCSATCTVERGYVCPLVRAPCVPDCGDGILIGNEQCDPGIAIQRMACSTQCRWNPGWACTGSPPTECHATRCGDSKKEGAEGCDDGNTTPFDGCSATCVNEPTCPPGGTAGACTGKCGDGILLSGEQCDDGNNLASDGCSAGCTVEAGFTCRQPPLGDSIQVPVVYRDFKFGTPPTDFEPGARDQKAIVPGLVNQMLDAQGKPARSNVAYQFIVSPATFMQWYRDVPGVNHTTATTLTLWNNGRGGYVNRWGPNGEQWIAYSDQAWCDNTSCAAAGCANPPAGKVCVQPCPGWGVTVQACYATPNPLDGTPTFFPIDNDTFSPLFTTAANLPPPYMPNWELEVPAVPHNFSFTSEVRYWFPYRAGTTYTLDFLGDDDVWMFVNKKLAVDIGGIHTPQAGTLTITNQNAGTYGLSDGGVYEVEVFQAERQTTSSSYKLTLSGFNGAVTACGPTCGDRVVTPPEQCDNGLMNIGGYNQCTPDCKLGPYCGDMMVTDAEQCDNGRNDDSYGAMSGCGPGCKLPARCGDTIVQTEYGEQCDDGTNSSGYGGCTSQCQRGPYCGDGVVQAAQEQCDDGANDGTYGNCGDPMMPLPNCRFGPRCGDGIVQDAYGEQCEPTASNDPNCTAACRRPGICGDAVVQPPEQCDDGATENNGAYGGCAPGCVLAPHCGDAVTNGMEECDDGVNDNSYGGCSPVCKLAAHCGDGVPNSPYEQCDEGVNNGPNGGCSTVCKRNVQ